MLPSLALAASVTLAAAPYGPTPPPPADAPAAVPCPPPKGLMSGKQRKSARNFLIAGTVVFTVFYTAGSAVAASELDATAHAEDTPQIRDRRRAAYLSFFPVFGPLVASPLGRTKSDKAGLAGFGIMQAWGLAMLTTSAFMFARHRRAKRQLSLSGAMTAGGGFLSLRGRF